MTDTGRAFLFYFLALAIPMLLTMPAGASSPDYKERVISAPDLKFFYDETIKNSVPWPARDISTANFSGRPESLTVPDGIITYRVIQRPETFHLGRNTLSVAVYSDGIEYGKFILFGDLKLFGSVVYTTRDLRKSAIITEKDIKVVRRDISMLGPDIVSDPNNVIGRQLNISPRAGAVLYAYNLESPLVVSRGDRVTILARSGRVTVRVPGEARDQGAMGDMVRVKNMMSRKEVYARVIDSGTVEVSF